MTLDAAPSDAPRTDAVCPFLGMVDDPATHFAFPSSAQRCHASARPFAVDSAKQGRDCLTAAHLSCSRYHPPTPLTRVHPAPPALADGPATPSAEATRVTRATGGGRSARVLPRVPVAVRWVLLVLVLVAVCAVGLFIGSHLAGEVGSPSAGSTAAPTGVPGAVATIAPVATASPAPVPTASPVASPSATPAPTPVPSVTPSAAPSPRVHTVLAGETLTSIAAHYGVTVAALKAANKITTPNLIYPGQQLIIPPR